MSNSEFQKNLEKYAEVIMKLGLNVQPGQRVFIYAWVENVDFVRALTEQAYKTGASFVDVLWEDQQDRLIRFEYAPKDSFGLYSNFRTEAFKEAGERGDAILITALEDPGLLMGQEPELVTVFQQSMNEMRKAWKDILKNRKVNWSATCPATKGWAAKVFPEVPAEKAVDHLWDMIFNLCRIKTDDPIQAWQDHIAGLTARAKFFNEIKFDELKLTAPGTDLVIGLPDEQVWQAAYSESASGVLSVANIPTEETFTMPHREKVNGTVKSTKPLNYRGMMIDKFSLTFKDGKVVDVKAEIGEEHLLNMLDNNNHARYLGEIALVPHSSPISQSGRIFYNIAYDENASCHLALGSAYRSSFAGGDKMTNEEFEAHGGNDSPIHADFMIGSGEMDIDGVTKDGETVAIMRSGEWAFEV